MSLTAKDLIEIQMIVRAEVRSELMAVIDDLLGPRLGRIEDEAIRTTDHVQNIYGDLTHVGIRLGRIDNRLKEIEFQVGGNAEHHDVMSVLNHGLGLYKAD